MVTLPGRSSFAVGELSAGTLVLVEDDPGDALLVRVMVEAALPGVDIAVFASLAECEASWPDQVLCVLLDLGLPDSFGFTSVDEIRKLAPDAPVVVLTGRTDSESGLEALAVGAQDYLVKGEVDAVSLERTLRYAVERGRAAVLQREYLAGTLRERENERLERGLLPEPLLTPGRVGVQPTYRPGRERALIGGDFYDVVEVSDGQVHLLIGDVSGHGPDEAALGAALRIAWRSLVMAGLPQERALDVAEQVLLVERRDEERFATCGVVTLSADLRSADVRLAGHPPPLLVRPGQHPMALDVSDVAPGLGMLPGTTAAPTRHEFGDSWLLVLYTDGLIEGAACPGSRDRLGIAGVSDLIATLLQEGVEPGSLGEALVAMAEQRHGGPLTDDIAVVVVWR